MVGAQLEIKDLDVCLYKKKKFGVFLKLVLGWWVRGIVNFGINVLLITLSRAFINTMGVSTSLVLNKQNSVTSLNYNN